MDKKFTEFNEAFPEGDAVIEVWRDPSAHTFGYRITRGGRRVVGFEYEYASREFARDAAVAWLRTETNAILIATVFLIVVGLIFGVLVYGAVIVTGVELGQ